MYLYAVRGNFCCYVFPQIIREIQPPYYFHYENLFGNNYESWCHWTSNFPSGLSYHQENEIKMLYLALLNLGIGFFFTPEKLLPYGIFSLLFRVFFYFVRTTHHNYYLLIHLFSKKNIHKLHFLLPESSQKFYHVTLVVASMASRTLSLVLNPKNKKTKFTFYYCLLQFLVNKVNYYNEICHRDFLVLFLQMMLLLIQTSMEIFCNAGCFIF